MSGTFKIKHKNSTTYKPLMNGDVEAANKNIKKILRKMVEKHKHWHEKLSFALLGYRTTVRTSTRATPYMLVYGTEAVIPTEVEIPSLRIIHEAELDDAEWVKRCYEQLSLIDGKRMNTRKTEALEHLRGEADRFRNDCGELRAQVQAKASEEKGALAKVPIGLR
ncbi:uncharacterized protein [Nicotiana sylvestris]|uniref:uncharacterized protein n=1 Tax=Nicotiana sylvestris TaxID=4096 RepID=UPI00388CB3F6